MTVPQNNRQSPGAVQNSNHLAVIQRVGGGGTASGTFQGTTYKAVPGRSKVLQNQPSCLMVTNVVSADVTDWSALIVHLEMIARSASLSAVQVMAAPGLPFDPALVKAADDLGCQVHLDGQLLVKKV
ncbi:hypothetical protein D3867_37065 (plasmid) [Azospirillum argentinense]|uniref:Uncharacterized protein n=2 Tax=Azospirillum TaxID=191 RepID=A0A4D8QB10_AZOBR|nr:hypothetical protein D3867_37065 [Azospirillum argentinense]